MGVRSGQALKLDTTTRTLGCHLAVLFLASYNAGPNRIRWLRKLSADRGFDPNIWFGNVEVLAAEKIGRETVDYVRNINKYFIAYKLYFESRPESDPAS